MCYNLDHCFPVMGGPGPSRVVRGLWVDLDPLGWSAVMGGASAGPEQFGAVGWILPGAPPVAYFFINNNIA